jgi:hypothetical protein
MPPPVGAHQWFDKRYRCMFCPGGAGPGGRGYCRSSDVPCTNRDRHMVELVPRGLDVPHANRVHTCVDWGAGYRSDELSQLEINLKLVRPYNRPVECLYCERQMYRNDDEADFQERRARHREERARPLGHHIGWRRPTSKGAGTVIVKRERRAQLPWCGQGRYRCAVCHPVGQTRRISKKSGKCVDPERHMSQGYATRECVHFYSQTAAGSQLPPETSEQLCTLARTEGCEKCRVKASAPPNE